jgi:glucokinase
MIILAADVGGTKSNLGLFERGGGGAHAASGASPTLRFEKSYPTQKLGTLASVLADFLKEAGSRPQDVSAACVGIAGPVEDGVCVAEWLPWHHVDEKEVAAGSGIGNTRLINDMVATAWGVTAVRPEQLVILNPGEPKTNRNVAVIAAGTGLGESALIFDDGKYHALTSEGGHTDWAPRNETELGLFRFLMERSDRVNNEHVLRGRGICNVYAYFKGLESGRFPAQLPDSDAQAGDIAKEALASPDSAAGKAMRLFVSAYGARAGNLAMQVMSTGGVYVGGGIAPKNLEHMKSGLFMEAFLDKGPLFRPILQKMPVYVVMEQKTGLLGAAQYAFAHA